MSPDAHRIALLAASKVAWLTVLGATSAGCGGTATSDGGAGSDSPKAPDNVSSETGENPVNQTGGTTASGGGAAAGGGSNGGAPLGGASSGGATVGGDGSGGMMVATGGEGGAADDLCGAGTDAACCGEAFAAHRGEEPWPFWTDRETAQADPYVQACCEPVVQDEEQVFTDLGFGCCDIVDVEMAPLCTPWGPPVPPAFAGGWS